MQFNCRTRTHNGIAIGTRNARFLYGTSNRVSNMKASIYLFGGANDSRNRAHANCAVIVKFARFGSIARLFGGTNKATAKINLTAVRQAPHPKPADWT
jgi:hypothetical protein